MSATPPTVADPDVRLEVVFDADDSRATGPFPRELRERYGGDLRIEPPRTFANFVASVDGVVSLATDHSPAVIARHSAADRFVMGLLRARADAVLIGGATLRADPGHSWTAGYIYPEAAGAFRELRNAHGQDAEPRLVVLTASGDVGAVDDALILTTPDAAGRLRRSMPASTAVREMESLTPESIVAAVRADGHELILSEAGPALFGQFVEAGCIDDLFLTVSPVLAGSAEGGRRTLSDGMALTPPALEDMELMSLRRAGSHLLLRYRLRPAPG